MRLSESGRLTLSVYTLSLRSNSHDSGCNVKDNRALFRFSPRKRNS